MISLLKVVFSMFEVFLIAKWIKPSSYDREGDTTLFLSEICTCLR